MDRKFRSDEQWYISPLLELQSVKEDLLECLASGEGTIDRVIDEAQYRTEAEKIKAMLTQSVSSAAIVTEEEAEEAAEEVLNLDMFLDTPFDSASRTLENMRGNPNSLKESSLFTHKNTLKRDDFMKLSRQRKSTYVTSLKYDKYLIDGGEHTNLFRPQCSSTSKCDNDIIVTVDVLYPYNRSLSSSELRSSRLFRPVTKFLVRGETLLSDLRKKLTCQSDTIVPLDNGSELEPVNYDNSTAELFPSSFIFIHDTFYVDAAPEKAQDISFPIRNFMQQREIFDPVEAQKMDGVKIIDLKLRLGQPYLFQHSGNCEHLLVFHDLRLLHESDPRGIEKYPHLLYEKGNERKCEVCRRGHVEFVVEKHELLPNTYTYFCRNCFQDFNFVHGVKTHSFIAWPYTDMRKMDPKGWLDEPEEEA